MVPESLIHVTALRKTFGPSLVLDGVNLIVGAGEAVALLGSNGAGKTTLLKILATVSRPTRGTALVGGYDCVRDAEKVRPLVGLLAHGTHLYEDLTALENLRFWTAFAGLSVGVDVLRSALATVELERFANERVRTFSAGMRRRLSIARFLVRRPRVLLLDEPFSGLDQQAKKWLEAYLQEFKSAGGAALMVTHSFGRGLNIADRIAILAAGRVALDHPTRDLASEEVQRLYALHTDDSS